MHEQLKADMAQSPKSQTPPSALPISHDIHHSTRPLDSPRRLPSLRSPQPAAAEHNRFAAAFAPAVARQVSEPLARSAESGDEMRVHSVRGLSRMGSTRVSHALDAAPQHSAEEISADEGCGSTVPPRRASTADDTGKLIFAPAAVRERPLVPGMCRSRCQRM